MLLPGHNIFFCQWRTHDFCLGGAIYGQVKKLNNKIGFFKSLSNGFLESCRCDCVLTLGSALGFVGLPDELFYLVNV